MTVHCTNCSYPIQPDGNCSRCGAKEEPHSGTWAVYYRDVKRFNEATDWPMIILSIVVMFLVVYSVWLAR